MDFEEEQNDQFDRLPDALLCLVFNKLRDAQSLSRCILVCKRFASVIPEVDNVSLTVRRKAQSLTRGKQSYDQITKSSSCGDGGHRGSKNLFKSLIRKVITRPLQFLLRIITKSSSSDDDACCDCSYHSPIEVLKNFKEIRFLRMELPGHGGEVGSNGGDSFLRWRAEFGSQLECCVIVGAKSFHKSSPIPNNGEESDQDLLLNDDELKMRVVWTISCLISASSRHHLLQQVVSEHRILRSVVVADGSKQGRLSMRKEQIEEMRSNIANSSADLELSPALERTPVPALKMKLWYVPVLELPASGCVMKGATLLVIRPVDGPKKAESVGDLVERVCNGEVEKEDDDNEKVFGEAVKEMMKKKKTYSLEMNSF